VIKKQGIAFVYMYGQLALGHLLTWSLADMLLNAHLTELRGASSAGAAASAVRVIVRIVVAPPAPRCLSLSILLPLLLLLAAVNCALTTN